MSVIKIKIQKTFLFVWLMYNFKGQITKHQGTIKTDKKSSKSKNDILLIVNWYPDNTINNYIPNVWIQNLFLKIKLYKFIFSLLYS